MIDLKDFVSKTIVEVVEGVKQSGATLKDSLGNSEDEYFQIGSGENVVVRSAIEFDISITTTESASTEGKAGVMIKVLDFGIKGNENASSTAMNKIKFKVPLVFPYTTNKG